MTTISGRRTAALLITAITLLAFAAGTAPADAAAKGATAKGAAAKGQGAWVRAAHLIPGLGTMSIGLTPFQGASAAATPAPGVMPAPVKDGMRAIAPAAGYGQVTDYQQIPAGIYTITVRPAGAAADSPPLISGTLKAGAGQAFTVAGLGTKSAPRVEALPDDLTPPAAGKTRVRLLPAASAAKTVTVTAMGGPAVAQDAAFGRATGYAAVPAGPWTLKATSGGGSPAPATSKVDLAGGSVYTLLVLDSGSKLKVSPVLDASGLDVMPAGGAQTGGGYLATHGTSRATDPYELAGLALTLGGALLLGALALGLRRGPAVRAGRS